MHARTRRAVPPPLLRTTRAARRRLIYVQDAQKEEEEEVVTLSKKQKKHKPDVVEVWDGNAPDPKLLAYLKSYRTYHNCCSSTRSYISMEAAPGCKMVHEFEQHSSSPPWQRGKEAFDFFNMKTMGELNQSYNKAASSVSGSAQAVHTMPDLGLLPVGQREG